MAKLVASTMADIGRIPSRVSRTLILTGEGPLLRPVTRPMQYSGHPSSSREMPLNSRSSGHEAPSPGLASAGFFLHTAPGKRANTSRATPSMLSRSPLFGVIDRSSTASSSPSRRLTSSPGSVSAGSFSMPNSSAISGTPNSSADRSIPQLLTPSKSRTPKTVPSASAVPGRPQGTTSPMDRFGAAVMTSSLPAPSSTVATKSSFLAGCGESSSMRADSTPDSRSHG
ncbi:MAG: hypothetical protein BWY99_00236 [Synergistetes bacterium ADurb.BinA166]|nr:MAG: hypothetical protein BWY99_00236 [Synergistetes bacterium ADurb.BinA166]